MSLVIAGLGSVWFYVYSGDIPAAESIETFAPNETATLYDECSSEPVRAVPFKGLGKNLQNAVQAAEGDSERMLAVQISRSLFCHHRGSILQRHLLEYKASIQIRRRFAESQLLAIYLNRAYFGDGLFGIENASEHFYQKHPAELTVSEAAMIAGLIKAPRIYSPTLHPDRAKVRRDAVITAMLKNGTITKGDAEVAIQSPVGTNN
jgi:membrane carboxypeptidase/penicillin-binding protein